MRIGIFTNNYLPNPYGVTGSIESFRKQLEAKGHTVFVFAPKYPEYQDSNPRVFRYPALDINFKFRFPLAIPYSRKMDKIIAGLELDIIHAQHPNLLGTAAKKWARRKRIPLVFTWHTLYDQYAHFARFIPPRLAAGYIIRKAAAFANHCQQVVIPTESIRQIIEKWGVRNKNIVAIPTGVEEDFFMGAERAALRKKYGVGEAEILLLLVSRLTQEKNVEFLVRALAPVLAQSAPGRKTKMLIAGGGDLLEKLRNMAQSLGVADKIIFAGEVQRAAIKNYYAAGDIFVYASKSETQGMIISEAMYAGLPVVAVRATGICDLVEDGQNGFLVEDTAQGQEKFAGAVAKLIGDEELRKRFATASARIAREKYTSTVCAEKMRLLYAELIKANKSSA